MNTTTESKRWIRPCTLVYSVMLLLTLVTWAIGKIGAEGLPVALTVLFLALFKGQLVGDWFMGLRGVKGLWRWVIFIWLFIPGILITTAFYLSGGG
ncbi:MAG: cytochrome C oxidase subunit IV family protein [Candidatus Sedimenticola sp. 20ELBAFRAG]